MEERKNRGEQTFYFTGALKTAKITEKNEGCPGLTDAFFFTDVCLGAAFWACFFFTIYPIKHAVICL